MFRLFAVVFTLCLIKDAFPAPIKNDRCSQGMDIAFLIDASMKHNAAEWKDVLNIPKLMVDTFGASEQGNHYAVMTFNDTSSIEMNFNSYSGTNLTMSVYIKAVIDGLKMRGGQYTFIDRALNEAQKLFTMEAGMRQNRTKVAVVIYDSVQGTQSIPLLSDSPIGTASKNLQSKGVEIYALGIGGDIDVLDLLEIASSDDKLFSWARAGDFKSGSDYFGFFKSDFCKST